MAYPVEGKGHGGNRLICSPQGVSVSLSLSFSLHPFLFLSLATDRQSPSQTSSSASHCALPSSPGFQSQGQMKLLEVLNVLIIKLAKWFSQERPRWMTCHSVMQFASPLGEGQEIAQSRSSIGCFPLFILFFFLLVLQSSKWRSEFY